jgi:cation-transporting ATPase I
MRITGGPRFVSALARDAAHAAREEIRRRRVWVHAGRAHIEARGVHHVDVPSAYLAALEREAAAVDGVRWAAVNGVLGDVIVDFDPDRTTVDDVRRVVERVEREHGMSDRRRDRPMHPSAFEPVLTELIELAGDVLGTGIALVGRSVPGLSAPPEAMAALAILDHLPELRRALAARWGGARVELAQSLVGSLIGAVAQTPLSSLADAALRAVELPAALARRHIWEQRADELAASQELARADPQPPPGARPVPLPDGPVERYARKARLATGLVAGASLPIGGLRNAARAVVIGAPRAARMGADAFAAALGRILASRRVVVRDPRALRTLDRIDTVVVDAGALTTGQYVVADVLPAASWEGGSDVLRHQAERMLDRDRPREIVEDGGWRLAPLEDLDVALPPSLAARVRQAEFRPHATLVLSVDDRLAAAVALEPELDPLAHTLVGTAHLVGRVVVSPMSPGLAARVGADEAVSGGSRLAASVRALQAEGHAVVLIGIRNDPALAAADVGIGVLTPGERPPWAADVLCGPGLVDAWLLLHACVTARSTSDRSVRLAMLGSISGALLGLVGPQRGAGRRGMLPMNAAALTSVAMSVWSANRLARRPVPLAADSTAWHALAVEQALRELRTAHSGLSPSEAEQRRDSAAHEEEPAEGLFTAAIGELDTPLTAPLAAGAGVSAATGSPFDAGLVGAVMVGNAILGAVQRVAASRAVRRIAGAGALRARLRREGSERVAPATELVPGDVIVLQAGDAVPADGRLLEAQSLEVDESSLTGESLPVAKHPAPTNASAVADRSSMVYAGTTVAAGSGSAVVVAVGRSTEAGRGARAAGEAGPPAGVEARLQQMTAASIPVALGAAAGVFAAGLVRRRVAQSISSGVALAVAAVPEGLPFVATIAQLAAARRLSQRNVLVRTPRTLEALGRVNVVCFDKTGTLTEGRIELRRVHDGRVDEAVDALTGYRRTVLAAALRASPLESEGEELPHPTDRAVSAGGQAAGVARDEEQPGWQMVQELPFEPGRGFHAVLGRADGRQVISVKGAPEIVLPRCTMWVNGTGSEPLSGPERELLERQVERLAQRGYRVLAVAERSASDRRVLGADRVERLEFLGLLCLADSVRPTAAAAVGNLRRAGVEVVMLTGDHPSTAEAIAAELGLRGGPVVTGPELDALDESRLAEVAGETSVFARVSPTHKVLIVQALQRAGRAVAVTGDGANDAPAIRLADVGIAVGARSTPAARQAADIVITDDRIETIVDAVIESRAMWRSVRDSVALLVGGNFGEIGFTLGSALLSATASLNARQLLLVNLLTDLVPALVVAARPPRNVSPEALLTEGPDAAVSKELTRDVIARAIATTLATTGGWLAGRVIAWPGLAGTVAFASLVAGQLAQTAVSARGDPVVLAAAIGSAAVLFTLVQFPPTSLFFGCLPLGPVEWTIVLVAAVASVFMSPVALKALDALAAERAQAA